MAICSTYIKACMCYDLTGIKHYPGTIDNPDGETRLLYKITATSETVCVEGGLQGEAGSSDSTVNGDGVVEHYCRCQLTKMSADPDTPDGDSTKRKSRKCDPNPVVLCGPGCTVPLGPNGEDANGETVDVSGAEVDPEKGTADRPGEAWCKGYRNAQISSPGAECVAAAKAYNKEMFGEYWATAPGTPDNNVNLPNNPSKHLKAQCEGFFHPKGYGGPITCDPNPPGGIEGDGSVGSGCTAAWVGCGNQTQQK